MKEKSNFLEIGKIVSTHGLHGDMRVVYWCDSPEFLCEFDVLYLGKDKKEVNVTSARVSKNVVIMHLDGVETVESAQNLRNQILYMSRDQVELPQGTYFYQDLIGLKVIDAENGKEYGILNDIQETGANDIYEVKNDEGSVWIPAIPQVIEKTDIENNVLLIKPMEGLF
jgi:16S rRNA processing protein RimM